MALLIRKMLREGAMLGVWRVEESDEWYFSHPQLSERIQNRIDTYKSIERKLQGIAVRILIKDLLPDEPNIDIDYDEKSKPYFVSSPYKLSISHSREMVAVLISSKGEVGVDVEGWSPKIERIAHKFMNATEVKMMEDLGETKKQHYQHVLWGAKESMFKLYGKGSLDFKKNMVVPQFELRSEGEFTGKIEKDEKRIEVDGFYSNVGKFVLVYVLESRQSTTV